MLNAATRVVARACAMSRGVQASFESGAELKKRDASPVTVADFAVQALILAELHELYPSHKFIAEETSSALQRDENLLLQVQATVNAARELSSRPPLSAQALCAALDLGNYAEPHDPERPQFVWVLDPIDGTKGFMRKQQFCIALALLQHGIPHIGLLGCPNLPPSLMDASADGFRDTRENGGVMFHALRGAGAWMQDAAGGEVQNAERHTPVRVSDVADPMLGVFMESVESGHSSHALSASVAAELGVRAAPVRMDSQAKYGVISRGEANLFMRFPRAGYVENIWDHAAGVVVIEEAGGIVSDGEGRALDFSRGRFLNNKRGIVASNGKLHAAVLRALARAHHAGVSSS